MEKSKEEIPKTNTKEFADKYIMLYPGDWDCSNTFQIHEDLTRDHNQFEYSIKRSTGFYKLVEVPQEEIEDAINAERLKIKKEKNEEIQRKIAQLQSEL